MSRQAAEYSLNKYATTHDAASAEKVAQILLNNPAINGRFDTADVVAAVRDAAEQMAVLGTAAKTALDHLEAQLENAPGTVLIAVFPTATASSHHAFGPLQLGPAGEILSGSAVHEPPAGWDALPRSSQLAVRVDDPAPGARGRRSAFQWLRAGLGGLYLGARSSGADVRIGPIPADDLSPAAFVGTTAALTCLVQALRTPGESVVDVSGVLADSTARSIVADCLDPTPDDLVASRLRDAAPWVQLGFDALTYPDAVLSLGIALECLLGSESASDPVTQVVSRRAGFLLRQGRSRKERVLTTGKWRDKTKSLYDARSTVAHGRYTEGAIPEEKERQTRRDFEDLVSQVAFAFRLTGRKLRWMSDADLREWQEQLELA